MAGGGGVLGELLPMLAHRVTVHRPPALNGKINPTTAYSTTTISRLFTRSEYSKYGIL